jgi:hypothetical protein
MRSTALAARALALAVFLAATAQAWAEPRTPAPPNASVFFPDLQDGATIPPTAIIRFGASGVTITPAGEKGMATGHHHLLIDTDLPPLDQPIPSDFNHLHFGKGQTQAEIKLPPGEHTLQLLLGDHAHVPHDPPVMSGRITVKVVDPAQAPADAEQAEGPPRTPAPAGAKVGIAEPADGATVPPTFTVKLTLEGMEVVPAGTQKPNSGHHHLLIDAPVPPLENEVPSDFNHVHLGKGQTEIQLTLKPGPHTIQALLADHQHVPHDPPVMSQQIRITVADGKAAPGEEALKRKPSPPDAAVYFVYPHNGETIYPTSTIRFGLRNMGVAPAGVAKANTGHHHLIVDADTPPLDEAIPSDLNHLHFGAGQTEKRITLPPGKHTLQLILADEKHVPHDPPVISEKIEVIVVPGGGKRRKK